MQPLGGFQADRSSLRTVARAGLSVLCWLCLDVVFTDWIQGSVKLLALEELLRCLLIA